MKNTMIRVLSVLMIAVLMTTCVISGVFAAYQTACESKTATITVTGFGITVVAANTDVTMLPGETKDIMTVTVTGEAKVDIASNLTVVEENANTLGLTYTLKKAGADADLVTAGTAAAVQTALNTEIAKNGGDAVYTISATLDAATANDVAGTAKLTVAGTIDQDVAQD